MVQEAYLVGENVIGASKMQNSNIGLFSIAPNIYFRL